MAPKDRSQMVEGGTSLEGSAPHGKTGVDVVAMSLANKPGHWRAGHFWPSNRLARATLTEAQVRLLQSDKRIQIMNDILRSDLTVPTTEEIAGERQREIDAEIERLVAEGIREKAISNLRRRGAQTAAEETRGQPGFTDIRNI